MLVSPRCLDDRHFHFIGADGVYYPCCFARDQLGRRELKQMLGSEFSDLKIKGRKHQSILESTAWKKLIASFSQEPMTICRNFCPKQTRAPNWGIFDGINSTKLIGDPLQFIGEPMWFSTIDLDHFWQAFDQIESLRGRDAVRVLHSLYGQRQSEGLADFYTPHLTSSFELTETANQFRPFYQAVRAASAELPSHLSKIDDYFVRFRKLHRKAKNVRIFFVIGRGTESTMFRADKVIIALETFGASFKSLEIPSSLRNRSLSFETLPEFVRREVIRFHHPKADAATLDRMLGRIL